MTSNKITSIVALIGVVIVISSIIGRYFDLIPFGIRNMMLVIGLTLMLLGTIWKVVTEMNNTDNHES